MMGLRWVYLACMEGNIYDISQWAACQKTALSHLTANSHNVQYRIVLGDKPTKSRNAPSRYILFIMLNVTLKIN